MIRSINKCNGKQPYKTKEEANIAAKHLNGLGGKRVKSYKCPECAYHHIGHESRGRSLNHKDNMKRMKITHIHEPGVHVVEIEETHHIAKRYLELEDHYILTGKIKEND